jgi:hypothetical protein
MQWREMGLGVKSWSMPHPCDYIQVMDDIIPHISMRQDDLYGIAFIDQALEVSSKFNEPQNWCEVH